MFLKRLDVVGFKSFASRVSVEFVPGVTAVVGPNGSGKSNITDAIRWVLGEQSAKSLRGAKMEDIIFAGSDTRKSLNVAEVTLTLQNDDQFLPVDYHEVSVTRRVYRSGDSEFYINKQSCRLKDIVDLFMDSGLGREAFSIISQGKVEEILSSKAEERRTIFEEAAGVLKYKSRKKKAEMKLMETQENLNRIEDILYEIEGQIEPLKIQSSIAKDYLEKKEELEKTEVALTVREIEELHKKWEGLLKQLDTHRDQEIELSSKIQSEEALIEQARERIRSLDESIDYFQDGLLTTSQELEKLEGQRQVLKERKKNAGQNQQLLEQKINDLKERVEQYREKLKDEHAVLTEYNDDVEKKERNLKDLLIKLDAVNQDIDSEIERLKSEYIDVLNRQAACRNEIKYMTEQLSQQKVKEERITKDNEKYVTARASIIEKKDELKDQLIEKQKQVAEEATNLKELEHTLEKEKQEFEKKQTQLYKAYQFIQQFRSRKEMLEELQDDYSGYFQGVKEVLKAQLPGVEGAVAELITVDQKYETAIEIALGGAMQHVVVDHEENARRAIQFLKEKKAGRATFLPMNVIREKAIPAQQTIALKNHQAFVGIASSLITADHRYQHVVSNLLGNVIVAEDLPGANALARLANFRYRIVTLDGDVVNPGGSMTGGSVKQKSNSLLSRQRELEDIVVKLRDAERKTAAFEDQVKELKERIKGTEQTLEQKKHETENRRLQEHEVKTQLREIEIEEKNINERLALYDQEMASYYEDSKAAARRQEELKSELEQCKQTSSSLEKQINELTEQKQNQVSSKELLQADITELKVNVAEKRQAQKNQAETVHRLSGELEHAQSEMLEVENDLKLLSDEMSTNSSGEGQLDVQITEKQKQKKETTQLISGKREERFQLQMELEDRSREIKELKRQHKQYVTLLQDEEVKVNRLDVELENLLTHLREEYKLTFEAAREKYTLEISMEEARKSVRLIKKAIEELGTVNLGAIEEFDRISERYTFLSEQKSDLIEAKETLHKIIDEMDEEMKKRFESHFYSIKAQFEHVFKELFGGGRADLQLTDPNDILRTGVDIVAQPPGKKLQNLSLLSGGERALTAIALLFAILKVRPVPFCVLDEVEAALDDANVHRFAQFLKRFSTQTQFIVITHRKGTMEEADVLYGVTMQESGVSRMVSVRLEESKELLQQGVT